jgi:ribosomal protein S18 acetylase RimI-like enzyme
MAAAAGSLTLRPMAGTDIATATVLSREQAWPHREEDWALFLEAGEGIGAERAGRVLGTVMAWRYGEDFAAVGMVIVASNAQGQGVGRKLMEAVLDRLAGRTVVLNATAAGLALYEKLGFVETGGIHQHQALAPGVAVAEGIPGGGRVRTMGRSDGGLGDLYSRASGMDRTALFERLAANAHTAVLTRDHQTVGFAQVRRFGRGWLVGPVVAPDPGGAKALILHALHTHAGTFCRLDVTGDSGLSEWLEEIGLPRVDSVKTMVRGRSPEPDPGISVHAIAAQALG